MLYEIRCDRFQQKRIRFNSGLSVVLGTRTGDNSIGKSTFLLIVDFVFGGSTYAKTEDIIKNVGSHDIYIFLSSLMVKLLGFAGIASKPILFGNVMMIMKESKKSN